MTLRRGTILVLLLVVAGLAVAILATTGDDEARGEVNLDEYPYPVQMFEDQGQQHIGVGQTFDGYNSNPPTSGPHSPLFETWGVHDVVVPKEVAVHNMEHAGVIVWYNCNGGPEPLSGDECAELRNELSAVVQVLMAEGKKVLMTPFPEMPDRIALTAWQYLDSFNEFDRERVEMFIDTFECNFDPEGFCR
jgi:hypothetical protein